MENSTLEVTVPSERLLSAMVDVRKTSHKSRRQLARSSHGQCTARNLRKFESGELPVDDSTLLELTSIYQHQAMEVLEPQQHLEISLDVGTIHVGGKKQVFEPVGASRDDVLRCYLTLMGATDVKGQTEISFLAADLNILAQAIEMPTDLLRTRLYELLASGVLKTKPLSRVLRKKRVLSAVGAFSVVSVGVVVAALLFVPRVLKTDVTPLGGTARPAVGMTVGRAGTLAVTQPTAPSPETTANPTARVVGSGSTKSVSPPAAPLAEPAPADVAPPAAPIVKVDPDDGTPGGIHIER